MDPIDRWCEEFDLPREHGEEILEWALYMMDQARTSGVQPMSVLQAAGMLYAMAGAACDMPYPKARELWEKAMEHWYAVARDEMDHAESDESRVVRGGLEIVT